MRNHSEERPQTLRHLPNGAHEFNWNITENPNDGYDYESVDIAGELTRQNIKYAVMLEHYDGESITECENIMHNEPDNNSARIRAYKAMKEWVEEILETELGDTLS